LVNKLSITPGSNHLTFEFKSGAASMIGSEDSSVRHPQDALAAFNYIASHNLPSGSPPLPTRISFSTPSQKALTMNEYGMNIPLVSTRILCPPYLTPILLKPITKQLPAS
jgi:hypothetical protein